jgi:hypothetical protein
MRLDGSPWQSKASKQQGKRLIGGQPGHTTHERKPFGPDEVSRVVECKLTAEETRGLRPLQRWRVVQQVELVERPFVITEYRVPLYRERRTGQIVTVSLPPEVAAAG